MIWAGQNEDGTNAEGTGNLLDMPPVSACGSKT